MGNYWYMREHILSLTMAAVVGAAVGSAPAAHAAIGGTPVLRYSFDQGTPVDESGHGHALTARALRGGATRAVERGTGRALRFPTHCTGRRCPKVVLQTPSTDELNPGSAPFRYGATVLLPKRETTSGQNVLQKGYSSAGGQYKLQIDGKAGRPSCVLVGTGRRGLHQARSPVSVADGGWHTIECQRAGSVLSVVVDGVVRATKTIPANLSVANQAPLSIGGKGAYTNNDQFQGTLDDLWIAR
jgi:hypothetical protein